jgi:hypothetical protein
MERSGGALVAAGMAAGSAEVPLGTKSLEQVKLAERLKKELTETYQRGVSPVPIS